MLAEPIQLRLGLGGVDGQAELRKVTRIGGKTRHHLIDDFLGDGVWQNIWTFRDLTLVTPTASVI